MLRIVEDFIKFSLTELDNLKGGYQRVYPKVVFTKNKEKLKTLGVYDVNNQIITIYVEKRLMSDVLRTLGHELVHHVQNVKGQLTSMTDGNDGSDIENEANSIAGVLLRKFGEMNPSIHLKTYSEFEIDDKIKDLTKTDSHEFGCLMAKTEYSQWNKILELIPDEIIYEEEGKSYGKEHESHIAILYGFNPNTNVEQIKSDIGQLGGIVEYSLVGISTFENDDFDVLKFDIVSSDLHKLNAYFSQNYDNTNKFPNYVPHMTIAYLKKGYGQQYVRKFDIPIEGRSTTLMYSQPMGDKLYFNLE